MFKEKSNCLKVTWCVGIILCLALVIYECANLITLYLTYPVKSSSKDIDIQAPAISPNLILCNLNPTSSKNIQTHNLLATDKFLENVAKITACDSCTEEKREMYKSIREELSSPEAYFQSVGLKNASLAGHQQEDFFVNCQFQPYYGLNQGSCLNSLKFDQIFIPHYFNCYILDVKDVVTNYPKAQGISLVMHLGGEFNLSRPKGWQDSGLVVALTGPESPSTVLPESSVLIRPGSHMVLTHSTRRRLRLQPPYGMCSDGGVSYETCKRQIIKDQVSDKCRCLFVDLDTFSDTNLSQSPTSLPYCKDMSRGNDSVTFTGCVQSTLAQTGRPEESCATDCSQVKHTMTSTAANWPQNPFTEAFYEANIKNKSFMDQLTNKLFTDDLNGGSATADELVQVQEYLENNLVKVDFMLKSQRYVEVKDEPNLTMAELLKEIGGTMNIFWLAVLFIILVEVFAKLCKSRTDRK